MTPSALNSTSRRVILISSCAGSGARRARRLRPWANGTPGLWSPAVSRLNSRGPTLHRRTTTRRRVPVAAGRPAVRDRAAVDSQPSRPGQDEPSRARGGATCQDRLVPWPHDVAQDGGQRGCQLSRSRILPARGPHFRVLDTPDPPVLFGGRDRPTVVAHISGSSGELV